MGDIQTHEQLSRVIIATFRRHWAYEENYEFFELGNWLTDMSQFNDPYAFLCAKMTAWMQARPEVVRQIAAAAPLGIGSLVTSPRAQMDADDVLNLDNWADSMLGIPGRSGHLAGFLRNLTFFIGCEWFRRPAYGISPAHFSEIFDAAFTQYFPHEHLDFPPWPHRSPWGNREASPRARHRCGAVPIWYGEPVAATGSPHETIRDAGAPIAGVPEQQPHDGSVRDAPAADAGTPVAGVSTPRGMDGGVAGGGQQNGGGPRRILAYLDDEIEYVAELLTWIEHEWIRVNAEPPSEANARTKRLLLARWGHASHAIEDFFFHSNFVEFAWSAEHADGSVPVIPSANPHRQRRNYFRRRQSPAWSGEQLSPSVSYTASRVYTGSFGGEDVYHTFADAMEGLPVAYLLLVPGNGGQLLRQLATAEGRRAMADRDGPERRRFLEGWRRWADTEAAAEIRLASSSGTIDARSAARLNRALNIDRASFNAPHGPRFPWALRGPFAFFTHLLCSAQTEHDASEARSALLDAAGRETESASDDGASAENIGCHSLMSKDSPRKPPLRSQAITQAAWVTCYIARILARRLVDPGVCAPRLHSATAVEQGCTIDQQGCVDWLHLLQHFLCHPGECEQQWHLQPLAIEDPNEAQRDNLPALTNHTLRFLTPSEVTQKMRLRMRDAMAQRYRDLERDAENEWAHRT